MSVASVGERFTSLGESDQASVWSRISNDVHAFFLTSLLGGLGVARIAKKNTGLCVDLEETWRVGEGEELDVPRTAEGTEARQICFATRTEFVRGIHLITVNGHVVESEGMIKHIRPKTRGQ
jgi:hypothetical protein